jgi:phosphodiesterase/alkaline phosphatase D-like protein
MLGEGQWTWLEKQLRENEAQITIIVSSIQVNIY